MYQQIFYEALDQTVSSIKSQFDQSGYWVYCKLEDLLVKAAKREDYSEELDFVIAFHREDDFASDWLKMQLEVFPAISQKILQCKTFHLFWNFSRNCHILKGL